MLVARNLTRGSVIAERVEAGTTLGARFMGLMGRAGWATNAGLWLSDTNGIHMMFMRFPIDCAFLGSPDGDGTRRVVAVRRLLRPWTGIVWYVRGAKGVLELPVGTLDRSGTAVGDLVSLDPLGVRADDRGG